MTPKLTPTEADREMAAKILGYRDWDDATDYRLTGAQDRAVQDALQLLAQHAATARAEERERAALIAERDCRSDLAVNHGHEPDWFLYGREIAAAIRKDPA
ncbi:hypothetical protein [Sphingomonas sp. SRS2]|uniref:hypothetical protein n=1 Tax=Sphingomonas sp. SRS2 TaxID=133190 RepID=UPI0006184ABA|nr:hypothetical protein [Sphingomonas sp. SRS2]KKC25792.1 hypothetical protein WP12_12095 [Sphingomonas sp. SRS2]